MFKISNLSRILLAIAAIALLGMLKLPIWKILLSAPQYPEGLEMKIWHNTLSGDVQVISALNHYIGMRAISVEMFPELQYLANIILLVAAVCLILALIGRWWSALLYFVILVVADSAALYDFWRWGYDYGHNLNPSAPIIIPGVVYQPPVLGYKKLLNFEAWSLPDWGGWILMAVSITAFAVMALEWWKHHRMHKKHVTMALGIFLIVLLGQSCSSGPVPLNFGKDNCDFCKMTLVDRHYGCELVTKKGKAYKFDDMNCFVRFQKQGSVAQDQVAGLFVVDYLQNGLLIPAQNAQFLESKDLRTPMASDIAAFTDRQGLESVRKSKSGDIKTWEEVLELF